MINAWLFNRLQEIFGTVKVANAGMPLIFHTFIDPITGKRTFHVEQRGETYCVNCPFCVYKVGRHDHRFRLWINHHYGVKDPHTGHRFWELAYCYNENCMGDAGFRKILREMIYGEYENPPIEIVIPQTQSYTCTLPSGLVQIDSLPSEHPAIQFLKSRNFDPVYLSQAFDIKFAAELDPQFPYMYNRIIIPIYINGNLVGYQGRAIYSNVEPKYLTSRGAKLGDVLYGFDNFPRSSRVAVLVEGPSDVWRIGPGALGMFGLNLTAGKLKLLKELSINFVVVLLDGDVKHNNNRDRIVKSLAYALNKTGIKYLISTLPDDMDPADLPREEVVDYVITRIATI